MRLVIAVLAACLSAGGAAGQGKDAARAQSELESVRTEIERVTRQVRRDAVERDRLARALREAETAVSGVRAELARLRDARRARTEAREQLAEERAARQRELDAMRDDLARAMRAAYVVGREEPLKLLLNQQDPSRAGRVFAWYGYLGRARADRIAGIEMHVREIESLDAKLEAEERRLAELETARQAEVAKLEDARRARGKVLAELESGSRTRARQLERLKTQQAALEKLVRELRRALEKQPPVDTKSPFGRLRGQLAWPVAGRLAARYGETRAGAVKWEGVVIATQPDAPVRAVAAGRVAYADWLPGLGLLLIVDHGSGYLSLYGYNERLLRGAGERVAPGDAIATAGDSGGRARTELYFEIRRAGRPIDPRPWFRTPNPP
jgi:septal ring factor EnvC (AmiA/AmiB activator)